MEVNDCWGRGRSFFFKDIPGGKSPWSSTQPISTHQSRSDSVGDREELWAEWERIRGLRDGVEFDQNALCTYMKLSKNKLFLKEGGGAGKDGHLGPACPPGNC